MLEKQNQIYDFKNYDLTGTFKGDDLNKFVELITASIFSKKPEPVNPDVTKLENGYTLVHLKIKNFNNKDKYSHLYKDGKKISNVIFRKGGMCTGFNDGYCALIKYENVKECFGTHCIINEKGEISLQATNNFEHPWHLGGIVASIKDNYYNLVTGEKLTAKGSSQMRSEKYVFVGSSLGRDEVYKINLQTAEVETFE